MPDNIPRPIFEEPALKNHQFSLVNNIQFQFWDDYEEPDASSDFARQCWWYQKEEPPVPAGWILGSEWTLNQRLINPSAPPIRSRMLYHSDEPRRLDSIQSSLILSPA